MDASEAGQRLVFETNARGIGEQELELHYLAGGQRMSSLYEYELRLTTDKEGGLGPDVIDELLSKPCGVRFGPSDSEQELWGILRKVRLDNATEPTPVGYRAWLVPRLWRTGLNRRSRVFQDMNVVDIAEHLLEEHDFVSDTDYELRLYSNYPKTEYTVQYQESDFQFLSRLLEHWGIFYFFVQDPDRERLILADHNRAAEPLPEGDELDFSPRRGATQGPRVINSLVGHFQPLAETVRVRDYNWRTPNTQLREEHPVDQATGYGETDLYGEHFKTPDEGKQLVQVRAEEQLVQREVYEGSCSMHDLTPGHRMTLADHPCVELAQEYLVVATTIELGTRDMRGEGDVGLDKTFEAIPYRVAFRPPRRTPKPRVHGFMHAKVDGPVPGIAAPIDDQGRYKVVLPIDLAGESGGRASRWIRMAQPSSGEGYGMHFPLHIGVEVALGHVDGDPDRPVIMASIPNAETPTPVTSQDATKSRVRTKSGITVEFEDDA